MTIQELLQEDLKIAMRNKDLIKKNIVILIKSEVKNESIELKRELTDDEVIVIINRKLKQTKDALTEFVKADRLDLINQSTEEIAVLESYLPKQLSEMEIEFIVSVAIHRLATRDEKINKGSVMKEVKSEVQGKADGKMVSKIVDQFLEGLK